MMPLARRREAMALQRSPSVVTFSRAHAAIVRDARACVPALFTPFPAARLSDEIRDEGQTDRDAR